MWFVYGIVSPVSKMIIYVGCTSQQLEKRLAQHSSDPASAAYEAIQWMRSVGHEPEIVIIDYFADYAEAILFETKMMTSIKGLVNKQHAQVRKRMNIGHMLEMHEIEAMMRGENVMVYARYTDFDGVDSEFVGEPKNPSNVAEVERRAAQKGKSA